MYTINIRSKQYMKKYILFFALFFLTGVSTACTFKQNNLDAWIGANSKFAKNYIEGKCAIETALADLDNDTKSIIAQMIARSYKEQPNATSLYVY